MLDENLMITKIINYRELTELLTEMFNNRELGLSSHQVFNGADFIQCPSCLQCKDIVGHATVGQHAIEDMEHSFDCNLVKLKGLLTQV